MVNGKMLMFLFAVCGAVTVVAQQPQDEGQSFRFRSAVELINVTATVTDASGRFVSGLTRGDFRVFEDGQEQPVTHFSAERVPVSLGIVLDTSSSMEGEKILAARQALSRFFFDLLDPADEIFVYRFDDRPALLQGWTIDRERLSSQLRRVYPDGATAMYDAVAEAVPLAQTGRHRKRAILLISDGNDTSSLTGVPELKRLIRESEVMVYAIGIDAPSRSYTRIQPRQPMPVPFPFPGRRPRPGYPPTTPPTVVVKRDDPVNVGALRELTDDSGGRTEIVRGARDLDPATANIADELSRQYYLGYPATGKRDGLWHSIRVDVRDRSYRVRARRGYVATP